MLLHFFILVFGAPLALSQTLAAESLAAQFSLSTSTSFPFPTATLATDEARAHVLNNWSLQSGRKIEREANIDFVNDPFPESRSPNNTTEGLVMRVSYPANTFSANANSGVELLSRWETDSPFLTMVLTYEAAFDSNFEWVKGGKMPGLRGGDTGCSGGLQPTGADCFTARLMWRKQGAGEAYMYIPTPNNICTKDRDVDCNPDFGTSIGRGSFTWADGKWNRITMLIQVNDPPDIANGNLRVYYNDVEAIRKEDLQFRSQRNLTISGLYISSFFGGSDDTWATPVDTHTYFRDFQLWGGSEPSTLQGAKVKSAAAHRPAVTSSLGLCVFVFTWLSSLI